MTSAAAPVKPASNRQTVRIERDFTTLKDSPLQFVPKEKLQFIPKESLASSDDENVNKLEGVMIGPANSAYAGGEFSFLIKFPPTYPFQPPEFFFTTTITGHPNVDTTTGTVCHDQLLATWAPNITLTQLLSQIHSLLANPNYSVPINGGALLAKNANKNDNFYDDETVSKIKNDLNTDHSTELAELVDMTFSTKPEAELQRLTSAEVIAIGSFGFRLLCNYHRWEIAEKNDRMFHEHTDETTRIFTVPFLIQPHSKHELSSVLEKMINDAKASYLKGFK